jgi:hypothetical protein
VPKLKRHGLGSTAMRVSRALLGSAVLLSILSANVPATLVASGLVCNLACCAGRAPHAAGSCMGGSCHAFLGTHKQKSHIHPGTGIEPVEHLCGLSRLKINSRRMPVIETATVEFSSDGYSAHSRGQSTNGPGQISVSSTALTKPCQSECGSCVPGFASSKRQRNAAALSYADRARPPSGVKISGVDHRRTRQLSARCRRDAPRGPPSSPC